MVDKKYWSEKYSLTDYMEQKIINQIIDWILKYNKLPLAKDIDLSDEIDIKYPNILYHFGGMDNLRLKIKNSMTDNQLKELEGDEVD